ncbi:MAG: hypothetical protein UY02_C0044G0005 [Candidatus Giovannonibacteria bacterium GW2011_GWB1_47_6b]|uniref:Uncharacterized protein n=1 Tax=Candidatus Giovannonibacteria bacterium GW2011_GWB1_47_6b TaxID=1618655 RepID=A0A0G1W091_9BACT|nr:MAG: hypothetical protein UY02_C0044G0005 [Candidatus Giovannonibacteria bacterium GW2011_GWB1_47_6b]
MSLRRTTEPLSTYSLVPSRITRRATTTSSNSSGKRLCELSKTSFTSARPRRADNSEPLKIRSSPFFPRSDFIDCSPSTHRIASTTLDFPDPFGPTIAVTGDENSKIVVFPNDLNPESVKLFNCISLCPAFLFKRLPRGFNFGVLF